MVHYYTKSYYILRYLDICLLPKMVTLPNAVTLLTIKIIDYRRVNMYKFRRSRIDKRDDL